MTTCSDSSPFPCDEGRPNCMPEHSANNDPSIPSSNFDCSICLDLPQDPVVTMCGHLFCWPCLHQWVTIHSAFAECPVCKAHVKDKIIPLYGTGKVGSANPETKHAHSFNIPRRPSAYRSDVAASRVPPATGFQHHSFISHENLVGRGGHSIANLPPATSFISPDNHDSRGGQLAYSAAAFGLFPALFGFHMITSPEYNRGFSSGIAYNAPFRLPAIDRMASRQRLHAEQEFVLYWFLILLASLAILSFLFF